MRLSAQQEQDLNRREYLEDVATVYGKERNAELREMLDYAETRIKAEVTESFKEGFDAAVGMILGQFESLVGKIDSIETTVNAPEVNLKPILDAMSKIRLPEQKEVDLSPILSELQRPQDRGDWRFDVQRDHKGRITGAIAEPI